MTGITSTRLSDGRELIYFDDAAAPKSRAAELTTDQRGLPPRGEPGEVRYDALTDEWVAVAAHRQTRTHLPPADQCPICPTTAGNPSEIPASDYDVVVFENRFPSLGPALGPIPEETSWGTKGPAYGRCEVVAFTPSHTGSFSELGEERARTVIEAWAHRTEALSALPGIKQVFPFENRGADIGVTLHHPHGQIYAYPYVTPRAGVLGAAARKFHDAHQGRETLTGSLLRAEREDGSRMVLEGENFSAYVPFAARWPLEIHLVPHRQVPDLAALNGEEKDELASVYLNLLQRVDALYPTPTPYISAWHQAPLDPVLRPSGYLHLQLTSPRRAADKLKYLAGSEAAMGAFINDTTPESVAERLREVTLPSAAARPAALAATPEGVHA
ncbi:UDPglucose--hexose-1-phosphate uridylyltransferase [Pseudarthrobacter oxydans]|uniref:Galactose-1-phosphate uridylyltransferase n=1 Tax=Pseudarthrobacter oxydans TaxID=1671 RepID=A0AAW8N9L8_PSEOX|nr:galactose-1-phosphate uridylyltransferase [Pseudarthrobacter oxydans]MDR6791577.1 UDPglucose--hexose-1-phosphate uridylyltransferase [Pseudarthrobacter oxydans]MDR7162773.1 UDPglucose--hexose-1-phosphate uridylyltransferase [Pseudarthrobacter oxydans]